MIKLVKKRTHTLDYLFICVLLVFFFSIFILLVTMGVRQYHGITKQALQNQNLYTASSYLREKFNKYDSADTILFTNIHETPFISFTNLGEKDSLVTYIYVYDGYLREFQQNTDSSFDLEQGVPIAKLQSLEWETYSNNLYCFTLTDLDGNISPIYISWNAK